MKKHLFFHRFICKKFTSILLFLLGVAISSTTYSQPEVKDVDQREVENAIAAIAKYTQSESDRLPAILQEIGYKPSPLLRKMGWAEFPNIYKIEIAYEEAKEFRGGNESRFLALLSKRLSQDYNLMYGEKALSKYLNSEEVPESGRISFRSIKSKELLNPENINIDQEVKEAIWAIDNYLSSNKIGVRQALEDFGLPKNQIYEILRSSNSREEALLRGVRRAKTPHSNRQRIIDLSKKLQGHYEGARYEPAIRMMTVSEDIEAICNQIHEIDGKSAKNATKIDPKTTKSLEELKHKLAAILDHLDAHIRYQIQEQIVDEVEAHERLKTIRTQKRKYCDPSNLNQNSLQPQSSSIRITELLTEVDIYLEDFDQVSWNLGIPENTENALEIKDGSISSESIEFGGEIEGKINQELKRKSSVQKLPRGTDQEVMDGTKGKIGGGIHFLSTADLVNTIDLSQHILFYDDNKEEIILLGLSVEDTYSLGNVSPEELKVLYRYAGDSSASNCGISIEKSDRTRGQEILLNPYFVDTKVGRYLLYTDIIPWDFDSARVLPNKKPNPIRRKTRPAYRSHGYFLSVLEKEEPHFFSEDEIRFPEVLINSSLAPFHNGIIITLDSETQEEAINRFNEQHSRDNDDSSRRVKEILSKKYPSNWKLKSINILTSQYFRFARINRKNNEILGPHRFYVELYNQMLSEDPTSGSLVFNFGKGLNSSLYSIIEKDIQMMATLRNDYVKLHLKDGNIVLSTNMHWKYLSSASFSWEEQNNFPKVRYASEQEDIMFEMQPYTDIMTGSVELLQKSYTPLRKVIKYAKITSLLKWAIQAEQNGNILRIDFSCLGKYDAHDPQKYRTPDLIRH